MLRATSALKMECDRPPGVWYVSTQTQMMHSLSSLSSQSTHSENSLEENGGKGRRRGGATDPL